jgi:hypothetical protein
MGGVNVEGVVRRTLTLILLHLEQQDEEEEAGEMALKQSWKPKFRR